MQNFINDAITMVLFKKIDNSCPLLYLRHKTAHMLKLILSNKKECFEISIKYLFHYIKFCNICS